MGPLLPVGRSLAVLNSALLVQLPVTGIPGSAFPAFRRSSRPGGCSLLGRELTLILF